MKKPNRFSIVGEWDFVGKGRVLDAERNVEVEAKMVFKSLPPAIETNPLDREDVATNLKLVREENGTMWEMIILDSESVEEEIDQTDDEHTLKFAKFLSDLQDDVDAVKKKLDKLERNRVIDEGKLTKQMIKALNESALKGYGSLKNK